jgi:hypothetical protein
MASEGGIVVLLVIVGAWVFAIFVYWRIYVAFRLLDRRVKELGFAWFSFQFQLPSFAKGMPGYVDYFDSLPEELKKRVTAIRREINVARLIVVLWTLLLILGAVATKWPGARGYG